MICPRRWRQPEERQTNQKVAGSQKKHSLQRAVNRRRNRKWKNQSGQRTRLIAAGLPRRQRRSPTKKNEEARKKRKTKKRHRERQKMQRSVLKRTPYPAKRKREVTEKKEQGSPRREPSHRTFMRNLIHKVPKKAGQTNTRGMLPQMNVSPAFSSVPGSHVRLEVTQPKKNSNMKNIQTGVKNIQTGSLKEIIENHPCHGEMRKQFWS